MVATALRIDELETLLSFVNASLRKRFFLRVFVTYYFIISRKTVFVNTEQQQSNDTVVYVRLSHFYASFVIRLYSYDQNRWKRRKKTENQ